MGFWERLGTGIATGGLSELWNPYSYQEAVNGATGGAAGNWLDSRQGGLTEEQINNTQLPYFQDQYDQLQADMANARGDRRVQASSVTGSPYNQMARRNANELESMASGRGPSLAAQQFRDATAENIAAQRANAAGGRGPQGARFAAANIARTQAGMASGAAQAQLNERMQARAQLGQAMQIGDNMDYQRQALNAQLQQQAATANQQAYLDMLGKQLGLTRAQLDALIAQNNARLGQAGLPTNLDRLLQVGAQVGPMLAGGSP